MKLKFNVHTVMTALVLHAALVIAAPALAADANIEQLRSTTLKLIDLLVDQGILTRAKADALIKEAQQPATQNVAGNAAAVPVATAPGTVRVPYVPEFVRKELKDEIRQELLVQARNEGWAGPGSVPEWTRGIKWDGDLRTRYQRDEFAEGNAPTVSIADTNRNRALTLLNTSEDRNRLRVRARLGLTASIDENWSAGVRLTTGSTTDPVSSNQTLGNYNNRLVTAFDRAYMRYQNDYGISVQAGRFANPWFSSDLVWANDLSFDGVATQWRPWLGNGAHVFMTLAATPVQEVELSTGDKWLLGTQVGLDQPTGWNTPGGIGGKIGLAYYRYKNIVGQVSPAGSSLLEYTAPGFVQKGNTYYNISSDPARPLLGLASDYKLVNLTASLDIPSFASNHLLINADYVKNKGFDRAAVSARVGTDVEPKTNGYQWRVAFGKPDIKHTHDWQVYMTYKRLERDAVLDAFTDTDFHLGGTDARGYTVGASYGIGKNTSANLRYITADSISGAPLSIDVLQFDLSTHF